MGWIHLFAVARVGSKQPKGWARVLLYPYLTPSSYAIISYRKYARGGKVGRELSTLLRIVSNIAYATPDITIIPNYK